METKTVARILVVDDETELERLIKRRLRKKIRAGELSLIFAHDGYEALEKLEQEYPIDLVLTDINMPRMDGLTLLNKLREIDVNLKTIVVSAYGDMTNIRTAMNHGAFDFLTKPIDFEDLNITIARTLEIIQQNQADHNMLEKMQSQLIQSEKMSALGQLFAGIAHEINNPINFIAGNVSHTAGYTRDITKHLKLYQQKFPQAGIEIEQHAEEIDLEFLLQDFPKIITSMELGIERIQNLSCSLRTFSRTDTDNKIDYNIHEGIDSALVILQHRIKANKKLPEIIILKEYSDLPRLKCYPGQLNQVFMNLITNAIDALEANASSQLDISQLPNDSWQGKILEELELQTLQTEELLKDLVICPTSQDSQLPTIQIRTEFLINEKLVKIYIGDNGIGIPEELQKHIFDYLFTTKSVGKGTGIGLSLCREVIEEKHGGKLSCISSFGQGSEFVIEIPILDDNEF